MKPIRSFIKIMDYQTFIVMALAIISTYLCGRFHFVADMPSGFIGIAIIFPIVFSINAAYRRREEALRYFAGIAEKYGQDGPARVYIERCRRYIKSPPPERWDGVTGRDFK